MAAGVGPLEHRVAQKSPPPSKAVCVMPQSIVTGANENNNNTARDAGAYSGAYGTRGQPTTTNRSSHMGTRDIAPLLDRVRDHHAACHVCLLSSPRDKRLTPDKISASVCRGCFHSILLHRLCIGPRWNCWGNLFRHQPSKLDFYFDLFLILSLFLSFFTFTTPASVCRTVAKDTSARCATSSRRRRWSSCGTMGRPPTTGAPVRTICASWTVRRPASSTRARCATPAGSSYSKQTLFSKKNM